MKSLLATLILFAFIACNNQKSGQPEIADPMNSNSLSETLPDGIVPQDHAVHLLILNVMNGVQPVQEADEYYRNELPAFAHHSYYSSLQNILLQTIGQTLANEKTGNNEILEFYINEMAEIDFLICPDIFGQLLSQVRGDWGQQEIALLATARIEKNMQHINQSQSSEKLLEVYNPKHSTLSSLARID